MGGMAFCQEEVQYVDEDSGIAPLLEKNNPAAIERRVPKQSDGRMYPHRHTGLSVTCEPTPVGLIKQVNNYTPNSIDSAVATKPGNVGKGDRSASIHKL